MNVSDFFWKRMSDWGVRRVYGFPGDGINGLMGGLARAKDKIEFIQARHEEMAAFMACAHAKFTGEVGVCLATSGPGAIHLLNGLYDARLDHQPVVAIVGQQARTALGGHYQQEVDLHTLFKDVAGEYVEMATEPAQVRHVIDRAMRIAIAERAVEPAQNGLIESLAVGQQHHHRDDAPRNAQHRQPRPHAVARQAGERLAGDFTQDRPHAQCPS